MAEHGGIELDSGYPSDSPASINKTLHSIENRSVHSEVSNSLDGISHASIAATHGGSPRPDIDLSQPADTNELHITE